VRRSFSQPLDLTRLRAAYSAGLSPVRVVTQILEEIEHRGEDGVWISLAPHQEIVARAQALEALPPSSRTELPLWGVPFSIKDCIDIEGLPTTSACPEFSYEPKRSNPGVEQLIAAGAIAIGKTNMDQFATGLNGTRSPYGIARNPFNPAYIPGGSSSGAAVSVSAGLVSFALGTDTGGSGRVPVALTNVIGLKPTPGQISGRGTVPACRSIETISVFALTAPDALAVFDIIKRFDPLDPFSRRPEQDHDLPASAFRFGIPDELEFFGDGNAAALFEEGLRALTEIGGHPHRIDYAPFRELNDLLFQGPWLAERYGSLADFLDRSPDGPLPLTRDILLSGRRFTAADLFAAQQRLRALKRQAVSIWQEVDVFVVPATPATYRVDEMLADPIVLNARLGTYTNFVNFAGFAGVAIPNGF